MPIRHVCSLELYLHSLRLSDLHRHLRQGSPGRWDELGEMVEAAADNAPEARGTREKMQLDGVDYDFVFSIDVRDDAPPIPLAYNHGGMDRNCHLHVILWR